MQLPKPEILIPAERIQERIAELAETISRDYHGMDEIVLVGVLKGAFVFLADLARLLTVPRVIDFVAVSAYGNRTAPSATIRMLMDTRIDLKDRHVILVEDIIDTGATLSYLEKSFSAKQPASLKTCVLLLKQIPDYSPPGIDYLGFKIPDVWVVGYGLDYGERYRTLPYVGTINPDHW